MKRKILLFLLAMAAWMPMMGQGIGYAPPPFGGMVSTDGITWSALTSTATTGGLSYVPPAAGLYGYNSSTQLWYPCSTANPCAGAGGGGGGATTFDQIGSGTNLGHGLVCGAGCVMSPTGGGFINANEQNGVPYSSLATGPVCNTTGTGVPTICTSAQTAAYAKNVIYASAGNSTLSVAACALNTNINTGGGTADDSCLQADLDALGAAGGGTLYLNGYALLTGSKYGTTNSVDGNTQTTALQTHSNIKIDATGGGVFMQASSNTAILGNNIQGNPAATFQTNMAVVGGVWNGNGVNQSKNEQGNTNNSFVLGFWFGGFNGLNIQNVTVRNAVTFAYTVSNATNFVIQNSVSTHDTLCSTTCNQDGIHIWGTLSGGYISNFTNINGDDDVIAINTDEGVQSFNSGLPANLSRLPNSGGAISNILIDSVNIINSHQPWRWFGVATTGGVATVSNITARNFTGAPTTTSMLNSGITSSSQIAFEDWNLTSNNAINVPTTTNLFLSNIISSATINTNSSTLATTVQPGLVTVTTPSTVPGIAGGVEVSAPNLTAGNAVYLGIGVAASAGNQALYGWQKTGTNTGYGLIETFAVGSPEVYAASYHAFVFGPVTINNGASGSNQGFTCNTGVQFCISPSSSTAAPFAVTTLGGIISSTRTGTFVCSSGGTITVANTNAITTSSIIITTNTPGGTQTYVPNKNGGTSGTNFTVGCATLDTSTYNYDVLN